METKYVRIPFDLELAKKITSGEVEGKVVTRDGRSIRIICWDRKGVNPIVALIEQQNGEEVSYYPKNGSWETDEDIMLEVPEPIKFKDGDIVTLSNGDIAIVKGEPFKNVSGNLTLSKTYVRLSGNTLGSLLPIILNDAKEATEDEINELKYKMQDYNDSYVKSSCKRFFGIQEKPCEFKPFDKVLVRSFKEQVWLARFFDRMFEGDYACTDSIAYKYCIKYEGNEHLHGTTENYK